MPRRETKRITRSLSDADRAKYARLREQLDAEKDQIIAKGRRYKAAHDAAMASLHEAFRVLKAERQSQSLSLSDVEDRTGIARSALSRLENDLSANPTIATLNRYAAALGKKVSIVLETAD
jgi:hypothetical protein